MFKILKNKIHIILAGVVTLIVAAGLIVGNVLCFSNFNIVTSFLCGTGLNENSEETIAARSSGRALAAKVEEEGAVLLKNENDALPLKSNEKVNVFGVAGSDSGFIPQGTGSGTGSRNDLMTFLGGLKTAEIKGLVEDEETGELVERVLYESDVIQYNEPLAKAYDDLNYKHISGSYVIEAYTDELYKEYYGVLEAPNSFYNTDLISSAKAYSSTAIVVIGRILGEGNDYSKIQYIQNEANDPSRKLQTISAREEYMLEQVCNNFSKVIVVFNTSNPMEAGFLEEYDIDAAIFMGLPGTQGTLGLANILSGKVSPSGKLADTWAYDLSTAASYATSGREGVGSYLDISTDTSLGTRANKYSDYIEDIYVGYKWYETAYKQNFWDSSYAKNRWGISDGYDDVVQFPFGYGMSYTDFRWTVTDSNVSDGTVLTKDGKIEIEVAVENIGDVPGADVVQLYYSAPYTPGGIEKSALNLGAFEKTAVLEPGKHEIVKIQMAVEDMKSYDCYDRNNNGFMGYELEGEDYTLSLRTDAHTPAVTSDGRNSYAVKVPAAGYKYEIDSVTKNPVQNQFTNYTNTASGASSTINEKAAKKAHSVDGADEPVKINYMTRADFEGTFPEDKPANRNAGTTLINDAHYVLVTPANDPADIAPPTNSTETSWVIQDLFGVEYEDTMWDELVSQLSLGTQGKLICEGGFGTIAIASINKPRTSDTDGPTGFNNAVTGSGGLKAVCYPSSTVLAQTWNWYMGYQVGVAIGMEANGLGIQGWYGPGANLHRSPTGGRNFEYYSEDPRLSGIICAYEVLGAKEKGLTAYIKHIAVNDSESGRNGAYKWLTEQNMRENYFLPFELCVKIGKSNAMMTSVDRIGSTRAAGSYAMLTAVLRDEWGFRGTVITDYYQNSGASRSTDTIHDVDECVRAGNSQLLWPDAPELAWFNDSTSNTAKKAIAKSAKDILFAYADTLNYSEVAQGLTKGSSIGTSAEVFPWWVIVLVGIDVTLAALMAFWIFMALRSYKKSMSVKT